ncbi:PWI domain-containing protein [Stachybotrys elegans]|uniref:PWI domain-containing protein n=1 Tax=Stachybotrys elegans TaxID=80388 RepID=A0A8K0SQJ0_9HYPO|nr:PWI domain-containing protein [Stachybotrys elegans]
MQKVNLQVMKKWIASRIAEILQNDDDVVIELCFNLIEGPRFPDIKSLQIQLTGFLDKDTAPFCKELWKLLLSAQTSPQGVPKELLEAKKLELMQEKIEADRAAEDARKRREDGRGAVAIVGKVVAVIVHSILEAGVATPVEAGGRDLQSHATVTIEILLGTVTFREAEAVVGGIATVGAYEDEDALRRGLLPLDPNHGAGASLEALPRVAHSQTVRPDIRHHLAAIEVPIPITPLSPTSLSSLISSTAELLALTKPQSSTELQPEQKPFLVGRCACSQTQR